MRRLAAADPVRTPPTVQPPERLRCLIEQEPLPAPRLPSAGSGGRASRRMLLGALLAAGICAALLLLDASSPSPNVNVGAEAYAATAPQQGIVEAVFVAHSFRGGGETLRQQEWQDSQTRQRRELDTLYKPHLHPPQTQVTDWSISPRASEEWQATEGNRSIRREPLPAGTRVQLVVRLQHETRALIHHIAFAGIGMYGIESLDLFRDLYRKGWMRLVGHERRRGRSLWKLESRAVGETSPSSHFARTRLVVLVDPTSFLPVLERQIEVSASGRPRVLVENELIRYRTLRPGSPSIFDLAAQHPRAPVVIAKPRFPKFVAMHPKNGRACPCYATRERRPHVRH